MDVWEYQQATDTTTHITSASPVKVQTAVPCRLSHSQNPVTTGTDVAQVTQTVKVFFAPEITIKTGSKVVVTQNGITTEFKHSGVEAVYDTHKEVFLDLFDRWA